MSFYDDDDTRLDYPTADDLVCRYIEHHATREQTTSVDVLEWSDWPNNQHNRQRVYDSLCRLADETDLNWAGRAVFDIQTHDR